MGQIAHVIDAADNDEPIQWKSRWFATVHVLASPHAPAGQQLTEWYDLLDRDDEHWFNFADYLYRVKP